MPSLCRNALAWGALWAGLSLTNPALLHAADPGWSPVGDVGAANVWSPYQVQTYEFTYGEYVRFLNAVDPDGTNPNGIYNSVMYNGWEWDGIRYYSGNRQGSHYELQPGGRGLSPVRYVSWWDAARVANWMHNGSKSYATTDASANAPQNYGAYALGTATSGTRPGKAIWSRTWLPTANEWKKAAFYKGGGADAGFWNFATQSDTHPAGIDRSNYIPTGGDGSAGSTGNYANWKDDNFGSRGPSTVGTNGGPSYYGAFDMNGNIEEWVDTSGQAYGYGGAWGTTLIRPNHSMALPDTNESAYTGFRLAREIYDSEAVWTGAGQDGLWSNPNNWFGDSLPSTASTKMWIKDQQFGSKVTIDEATHATLECNIIGPDWGADLDIIGGSLTQIAPKGWLLFAGSVDAANRAEINISEGGRLQAHNLCLGDSWWGGYAPYSTLTIDDPESLITVTDGLWVGGHFNALDGTIDITGEILVGQNANSYGMDKTLLNLEKATIIVRGKDVSSLVPGWVSNGWLTAYDGQGQLIVDTDTIPGGTILTAVLPVPEPSSTSFLAAAAGLLATFRLWSRRRNVKLPQ